MARNIIYADSEAYHKGYDDGMKDATKWVQENISSQAAAELSKKI